MKCSEFAGDWRNLIERDEDSWNWVFEKRGNYSVKSGYRILQGEFSGDMQMFWKRLWKLKVPIKVRNFLWRACSGFLPSKEALRQKRVDVDLACQICNVEQESVSHILVDCQFAKSCWAKLGMNVAQDGDIGFVRWLDRAFSNGGGVDKDLIAMMCWHLWLHRNDVIWNNKWPSVSSVINAAGHDLEAWSFAQRAKGNTVETGLRKSEGNVIWSSPPMGWIKVNVDAAIFPNDSGIGVACVVRNEAGELVKARSVSFLGSVSARVAETMAVKEALSWLRGASCVIVESDALDVLNDIRLPLKPGVDVLIDECIDLGKLYSNLILNFVRRSANNAAHSLAQASRFMPGQRDWFDNYPAFLTNVIASDLS